MSQSVSPAVGNGATLTLGTSTFDPRITNMKWSGITRKVLDATHLSSAGSVRAFEPSSFYDPGELVVTGFLDPDEEPVISAVEETITVLFPVVDGGSTGADWEANGFMSNYEIDVPDDELMTMVATFKLSGAITFTDEV
jgi:hypothetical protein